MSTFSLLIFFSAILGAAFCVMMMYRSNLIYRVRGKAWDSGMNANSAGTFDEMMWKLTKWTFKSFYPEVKRKSPGA